MDTDEEPSGLSLSSETETGCIGALTLCIVVGLIIPGETDLSRVNQFEL